ncbi:MAG: alpha/beta hydrolase [Chitinophagaceae bacterium]|nr:alpha/beta hydrolase [Chitinophagaceae bacterium]MBK8784948.1 alpha/beta hydrolase [Chitinophagaceae bacterium]MBL0198746.1 alpha/beta hydrolase [Chitinophagaceae bacterium]
MPFIKSVQNNEAPVSIYYEDSGTGLPVVFIHGWPLNGSMWEYQVTQLPQQGLRCITYDRRGFGKSDRPFGCYGYNTLAGDLKALLDELDLHEVTLVGFSMGGGEIAKYFSLYGGERVAKVVLISAVVPYMLQTEDNPDGVPQEAFDKMLKEMTDDRPGFLEEFNKDFYGVELLNQPVTSAYLANALTQALNASPIATIECAKSFSSTDFRDDIPKINVPTLIIHGDKDKTVPIKATAEQAVENIKGAVLKVYEGAPHGLWFTEKDKLNQDLIDFI